MEKEKKIKIFLGSSYLLIVLVFLWFFFSYFSFDEITSYELIKSNRDNLNELKENNIILTSILFFVGTIIWVLLLGFASPIFLIGGFVFGKWLGTFLVVFGLTVGATLLYIFSNFFLKELIKEKFSLRYLLETPHTSMVVASTSTKGRIAGLYFSSYAAQIATKETPINNKDLKASARKRDALSCWRALLNQTGS